MTSVAHLSQTKLIRKGLMEAVSLKRILISLHKTIYSLYFHTNRCGALLFTYSREFLMGQDSSAALRLKVVIFYSESHDKFGHRSVMDFLAT